MIRHLRPFASRLQNRSSHALNHARWLPARALGGARTYILEYREHETEGAAGSGGEPLVFLHGLLGSRTSLRTMAMNTDINAGRRVFALDMRNHGASPHDDDVSTESMARWA